MDERFVGERISVLRNQKKVSAREMSLAIGQNESYINRIENGHTLPSMQCFFYICEYLEITPSDFFNIEYNTYQKANSALAELREMDIEQLDAIIQFAQKLKEFCMHHPKETLKL